jgi:hypothetical protein
VAVEVISGDDGVEAMRVKRPSLKRWWGEGNEHCGVSVMMVMTVTTSTFAE